MQGLTIDFCFYFAFSDGSPAFSFKLNRFNVATSRARFCTLILLDEVYKVVQPYKGLVADFISKCERDHVANPPVVVAISSDESNQPKSPGIKVIDKIDLSKFEKPKKEIIKGKENIYIIDTNVFVDQPDIISKIDKQYQVVLSAKVIDELDKLKVTLPTNEQKLNVQKAIKQINDSFDTRNIKMDTADLTLLPSDFDKKSPDNFILTVALKYKDENPIMLTSDNGLQLKSKGFGITTIKLKDFLKQMKY